METTRRRKNRLFLPLVLCCLLVGAASVAQAQEKTQTQTQTQSAGYTIINPDGTRTHVQGTYTCPAGYTCTMLPTRPVARAVAPQSELNQDQIGNSTLAYTGAPVYYYRPAPVYYYDPYYGVVPPYFWPPLFFGVGYYWGGHHHHHHHPRPRPPAPMPRR